MFLESLCKLKSSYFVDGASTTKSGLIDCLFLNDPRYLLIDEIDKMSSKDQAMLLNLMETGILSEIKHNKTRTAYMKTSVFATSNNVGDIITPLQRLLCCLELMVCWLVIGLVWPGYGGLIYYGENGGHIVALKVLPATTNAASTPNTTTPTTTAAGQNSTSGSTS